jgi:hypothetical protein
MTFGFSSSSANGDVDRLVDAIYADLGLRRGSVSRRRVAAFVTARSLLDEGHGPAPAPEDTLAVASWLSTGRVALDAEDDDDEDDDEFEEEAAGAETMLRDWWPPVRALRRRRA